jgi:hypothetical protein
VDSQKFTGSNWLSTSTIYSKGTTFIYSTSPNIIHFFYFCGIFLQIDFGPEEKTGNGMNPPNSEAAPKSSKMATPQVSS